MNLIKIFLIALLWVLSFSSNSQNLSLPELINLRKMSLGEVEEFLTNKGWAFYNAADAIDNNYGTIQFSFKKSNYNNNAESFITYKFLENSNLDGNKIVIQINDINKYIEFIKSIQSYKLKLLKTKILENSLYKIYQGATTTFTFEIRTNEENGISKDVYILTIEANSQFYISSTDTYNEKEKKSLTEKFVWFKLDTTFIDIPKENISKPLKINKEGANSEEKFPEINIKITESKEKDSGIFTAVEQMAEFPGGAAAFARYLQNALKYPAAAQRANVQGRVYVQFVVNIDGSIQDIKVLKPLGFGCDEEAMRVIQNGPKWIPGKQSGRAIRSRFTQPITFMLTEEIKNKK